MIFLTPMAAAMAAGVAVPALVALYFLKLRRLEVDVSSTLLWKRAIKDMEVNSPFQKIKKNWLLLLQILTLLALLIAMARPVLEGGAVGGRRVVIVVDRSASMNATDVSPTRLGEAQSVAGEVADAAVRGGGVLGWLGWGGSSGTPGGFQVSGASGVMVVSFGGGTGAQVVEPFTNDPTLLRNAIDAIEPSDGSGGLATALGLVEPYARETETRGGDPLIVYVVSDGRVGELGNTSLSGAELRYVKVGTVEAKNVGITAVSARRDYRRPDRVRLFVRLVNSTQASVQGNLTVRVDGQVAKVSAFTVPAATELKEASEAEMSAMVNQEESTSTQPAGGSSKKAEPVGPSSDGLAAISMEFELTMSGGGLVEVSHDVVDALAADNHAALWVGKPRQLGVMVVTEGDAFLMQAIKAMGPGMMRVFKPAEYEATGAELLRNSAAADESQRFDVVVFDRYSPHGVPATPGLYLGACPPVPGVAMVSEDSSGDGWATRPATTRPRGGGLSVVLDWRRDHPLLRHVNLGDLVIEGASRLTIPENGEVLAVGIHGPLMGRVMVSGKSHVMTGFSLLKSNWPLQVGFPVFIANTVEWLSVGTSGEAGISYRPGDSAVVDGALPGLASAISTVSADGGGQQYVFGAAGGGTVTGKRTAGQVIFSPFEHVGVFRPLLAKPGDSPDLVLTSNLANPLESDLRPSAKLAVARGTMVAGATDTAAVRREVWRWFAWCALGLLVLEWIVWTRR